MDMSATLRLVLQDGHGSTIFISDRQLPVESKRYQTMDRMWRKIMNGTEKSGCPFDMEIKGLVCLVLNK